MISTHLHFPRVEGLDGMHETVVEFFTILFRLVSAEQTIPDYEYTAVIAINAVTIARVVHSMV